MKGHETSTILQETLEEFIHQTIRQSSSMPQCEFCVFSGQATDWKKDGGAIFLRLTRSGVLDESGNPHELWARLYAPAGCFIIPTVQTEMMVLVPPECDGAQGVGWAFYGAQLPPQSVTQAVSRWVLPDGTTLAASAGGWAFKGAHASSPYISIDRTTGIISIGFANGTHIALDPSGVIELVVTDGATPSNIKTAFRLDQNGVTLASGGKIAATWDGTSGKFVSIGADGCYLAHTGGVLGPAGTVAVAIFSGSAAPSTTWKIAG